MNRLRELAGLIDRRPAIALPLWMIAFLFVMWPAATRPLWYDELITYYISKSNSLDHFWDCVRSVDLQPPLNFLLVRLSLISFGDSPLSVRLPSIASFLLASYLLQRIVSRRL